MGKRLNQQRRGKGSPAFSAPSHRFNAKVSFRIYDEKEKNSVVKGKVIEFINNPAHSGLIMNVKTENGEIVSLLAPEGIAIGDEIEFGANASIKIGNVLPLAKIPDGMYVYNVELVPGDGGKLIRAAGTSGTVISHTEKEVYVALPSKRVKILNPNCRAQIGLVSMGGRLLRPIFKAGKKYHMVASTARYWPKVRGVAMSVYDHPFGGKQHHPGRSTIVARNAPPGRKVGLLAAPSVGRGRKKSK
ncbi:MAG: 50S ribosomal protein L2 [Candidatus Micrarchaeota archaeon]|nr:50S ribosomal protein L2 [Candidatus Micrarchaeota archaeon]